MNVHELIDLPTSVQAQAAFVEAVIEHTGNPPEPFAVREIHNFWTTSHIINNILGGSYILRSVGGKPSIEIVGPLD